MDILQSIISPDTSGLASEIADSIVSGSLQTLSDFIKGRAELHHKLWYGGADPAQVVKAMGAQAGSIFLRDGQITAAISEQLIAAGATKERVNQLLPGVPPGYAVKLNDDGTVTIG